MTGCLGKKKIDKRTSRQNFGEPQKAVRFCPSGVYCTGDFFSNRPPEPYPTMPWKTWVFFRKIYPFFGWEATVFWMIFFGKKKHKWMVSNETWQVSRFPVGLEKKKDRHKKWPTIWTTFASRIKFWTLFRAGLKMSESFTEVLKMFQG